MASCNVEYVPELNNVALTSIKEMKIINIKALSSVSLATVFHFPLKAKKKSIKFIEARKVKIEIILSI
jgi:hypothetical protein